MSDLQQASHVTEVLPTCTKCRAPMALKRLRAGKSFYYEGKFECETCGRRVTEAVKLQLTSNPPIAPTSSRLTRAKWHAVEVLGLAAVLILILGDF